ncbi:MAG: DUF1573 domain-containing protein [Bacteroides sp.]|nr:DUF1573 domain-containing protein [Bacteroides sp.]
MKKITLFLAILMMAMLPAIAEEKTPVIKFEKTSHDFGNIKESDGNAKCVFTFVNEGDAPLVIISASAQCGCTKPTFPQQPIAPGKKGEIRVSYNPTGRPGEFIKEVKVKTNDKKHRTVKLKISGVVIPAK